MDGRTLMDIMQSPNFAMWGPAEQAFNTTQEKAKADLATTLGLEQRNQAMHPAELAGKQAVTRLNNSTAAMNEDVLASNIPAAQRQKQRLQESLSKMDDVTRTQLKARVIHNLQLANAMKKNKGQLPEGFSLSPEEAPYFTPDKLDAHIAYGQAFMEMDPEWIAQRQKAKEAEKLAGINAQGRIDLKGTPSAGGGGGSAPKPAKNPQELMTEYTRLANAAKPGSEEQKHYLALAGAEWQKLQLLAILKAQAPQGGKVDPVATANDPAGGVVGRPMPAASPMPTGNNPAVAPSQGSPAQQRTVKMKASNGTIYEVAADKVEAAKARGWTRQ